MSEALQVASGSVLATIHGLRGSDRTLTPFEAADVADDESPLAENELLDPELRSVSMAKRLVASFRGFGSGQK